MFKRMHDHANFVLDTGLTETLRFLVTCPQSTKLKWELSKYPFVVSTHHHHRPVERLERLVSPPWWKRAAKWETYFRRIYKRGVASVCIVAKTLVVRALLSSLLKSFLWVLPSNNMLVSFFVEEMRTWPTAWMATTTTHKKLTFRELVMYGALRLFFVIPLYIEYHLNYRKQTAWMARAFEDRSRDEMRLLMCPLAPVCDAVLTHKKILESSVDFTFPYPFVPRLTIGTAARFIGLVTVSYPILSFTVSVWACYFFAPLNEASFRAAFLSESAIAVLHEIVTRRLREKCTVEFYDDVR